MLVCRRQITAPLVARARGVVNTKTHRRRKEFESKAYPRASTEVPNQLPRRGQRGGWMRNPSKGVAKLDGTNFRQQEWWSERSEDLDQAFMSQMHKAQSGERGAPELQKVLDTHLQSLEALRVDMPTSTEFLQPHVKKLIQTPKVNPVHEATAMGPDGPIMPMARIPDADDPPFLEDSLQTRRQRRGRFIGRQKGARIEDAAVAGLEGIEATKVPSMSRRDAAQAARAAGWSESDGIPDQFDEDQEPKHGRKSSRRDRDLVDSELPEDIANITPKMEPMEPTRYTSLGELWASHGASWVIFNTCMVPSAFPPPESESTESLVTGSSLEEYRHTREAASLFDVSYKVSVRLTGADREFVADQLLTCNLRAMRVGDVQYAAILDTKGLVLDDAFVYLTDDSIEVVLSGHHSRQLIDYIGQYVVYVRRSGADVALRRSPRTVSVSLQGPQACEALSAAMEKMSKSSGSSWHGLESTDSSRTAVSHQVLEKMPYMSYLGIGSGDKEVQEASRIVALRAGTTGEDGFEILGPPGDAIMRVVEALLAEAPMVRPAGVYCLDMLRMEAGLPRTGSDIPAGTVTPIRASLAWMLDQSKMRSHLMFGWERLFAQLAKGPRFRRVAIIIDGPAHGGCYLLSNPHRQPIGQITSTAWSPALQARVGMAYIKTSYAKAKKHILVTVPYNLPTHKMKKKAIRKWLLQGPLRSAYRRIVSACVVPLPLVPHRYPEPERQRRSLARQRPFAPDGIQSQGSSRTEAAQRGAFESTQPPSSQRKPKHPQPRAPMPGREALRERLDEEELVGDLRTV